MTEFDELRSLLIADRTVRRYDGARRVEREELLKMVELTRYCASGANMQPLRYRVVSAEDECAHVFDQLAWAAYLKEWPGPCEAERPTGYLVQCLDTRIAKNCLCDDGLQLQAITLGATSLGLGCCIFKSFKREGLIAALGLPEHLEPRYVVAIGYPVEKVVIEPLTDSVKYYRTPDGVHHVPKRAPEDLIV
ncbi:MAG: nitroreductase family protein [Duncaniella sp.]|nr:nitroreductase family protein [Duncaniella sp.]